MKRWSNGQIALLTMVLVLLIDQVVKLWIKTHMELGESIRVTDWFYIAFVENNGMAFGWELGSKLFLTLFRIVAVAVLVWVLLKIKNRPDMKTGFIVCLSLIIAGAAGNIIDCLFYGILFGYESFFYGRVVDMLYFPLFSFYWPDWMPWIGGDYFEFFRPVFNIADSAISVGVVAMLLFYRNLLVVEEKPKAQSDK